MLPSSLQIQTLMLLVLIVQAHSTRLPLEIYELTATAAAATTATSTSAQAAAAATATANAAASSSLAALTATTKTTTTATLTRDKHKNLEYYIYDAKDNKPSTTAAAAATAAATVATVAGAALTETLSTVKPTTTEHIMSVVSLSAEEQEQTELGRRSRQMLQQQQQQQQQHHLIANNIKHGHGQKDLRILYQVGDSEDDLPVCAPNAVCSKIDLYETPWIERQCRCPESNRMPNNVILHYHSNHQGGERHSSSSSSSNWMKEKLMMQHKRLLLSEFQDKKFESLHMKKLMQKFGAVYEDDLQLPSSLDNNNMEYNDALPAAHEAYEEVADNEFPRANAHMRHSGHRGLKETMSFIGGCPSSLGIEDGHTIADKTRHYKMCQPVHKLPVCKHFRDYTWTLTTATELNVTEQIVHCRCPKNSVTYLTKREPIGDGSPGYRYLFACSPLTRLRCQRKQPCKLFTVRKRQEFLDEVNINSLCQCPKGHHCPSHHTQSSVIAGESFLEDNIQTYSGYCMAND
ncbi:LOW QUALITY PROTEIN: protein giant-lens [Drosophila tropicalis]|uniref:LOW QUALITY PROTEIN: protein giant-lens n=1 Tax=Drosophila tropicalis TaxID=46794 RepID=UPI0035ABC232